MKLIREAIERQPSSAKLHNELGRLYLGLTQPQQALEEFSRAGALDPVSPSIRANAKLATDMLRDGKK